MITVPSTFAVRAMVGYAGATSWILRGISKALRRTGLGGAGGCGGGGCGTTGPVPSLGPKTAVTADGSTTHPAHSIDGVCGCSGTISLGTSIGGRFRSIAFSVAVVRLTAGAGGSG